MLDIGCSNFEIPIRELNRLRRDSYGSPNSSSALLSFTIKAGLETSVPLEKSRQDASDPIRGDTMERHHLPTHCVAGICDLVATGDVQQEEKIKSAGLETSVPLEKMPAGLPAFHFEIP